VQAQAGLGQLDRVLVAGGDGAVGQLVGRRRRADRQRLGGHPAAVDGVQGGTDVPQGVVGGTRQLGRQQRQDRPGGDRRGDRVQQRDRPRAPVQQENPGELAR
jgi:hypothetical protein